MKWTHLVESSLVSFASQTHILTIFIKTRIFISIEHEIINVQTKTLI